MKQGLIISLSLIVGFTIISIIVKRRQTATVKQKVAESEKEKSEFSLVDLWKFFTGTSDPDGDVEETTAEVIEENEENEDGEGIA